jgi:hypothetical protein
MNKAVEKLKEEFLAVLPPTVFFFIALHIVGLVRVLMTKGTGLPVTSSAQIALAALIIGKAVLLADLWPPINRFPEKPLVYNIVWKIVIYYVVASFIHFWSAFKISPRRLAGWSPATRSCCPRSCGRISGRSRSFCLSSFSITA